MKHDSINEADATRVEALREKIRTRTCRFGVIGMGHVALPLAVEFAIEGVDVTTDHTSLHGHLVGQAASITVDARGAVPHERVRGVRWPRRGPCTLDPGAQVKPQAMAASVSSEVSP